MPQINLSKDEIGLIDSALDQAISSAKRQQNMKGKTITMIEVMKKHEHTLNALRGKLDAAS